MPFRSVDRCVNFPQSTIVDLPILSTPWTFVHKLIGYFIHLLDQVLVNPVVFFLRIVTFAFNTCFNCLSNHILSADWQGIFEIDWRWYELENSVPFWASFVSYCSLLLIRYGLVSFIYLKYWSIHFVNYWQEVQFVRPCLLLLQK